ncbi:hypothetical protein OUZ56_012511, partial [Daphnia magna]
MYPDTQRNYTFIGTLKQVYFSGTHPNHIGLLSRAVEKLPIGGEDLCGAEFVHELISQ